MVVSTVVDYPFWDIGCLLHLDGFPSCVDFYSGCLFRFCLVVPLLSDCTSCLQNSVTLTSP